MFNKKGFMAVEMLMYFIVALMLIIIFSTILVRSVHYQNNESIKIYQSLDILRTSLVKYQKITSLTKDYVEFINSTRINLDVDQVYETPGYMPYLQGIENPTFKFDGSNLELVFTYKNKRYQQIIFYVK